MQDLSKKTEEAETKEDLTRGFEAAERVLHKANDAVNRAVLDEALDELINRVDDWKNHKVEHFGKLLLHGVYGVVTGKSDQEKDVSTCQWLCDRLKFVDFPSMRSISLSVFCFVAKKSTPTRTKTRRIGLDHQDPE